MFDFTAPAKPYDAAGNVLAVGDSVVRADASDQRLVGLAGTVTRVGDGRNAHVITVATNHPLYATITGTAKSWRRAR